MKKLFALFFLIQISTCYFSQENKIVLYDWDEVKNANPDTVYGISFSKLKMTAIPEGLEKFHSLKKLDLSKNKFTNLPDFIGDLSQLEILDISKNEFANFPIEICKLWKIKQLIANRNPFDQIPECIGYCTNLEFIDLWETPIATFPVSMQNLKKLTVLDIQGVKYGPAFQKKLKEKLPNVEIKFDPPCNCME